MDQRCSLILVMLLLIALAGCGKPPAERKLTFDQGRFGRLTAVVEAVDPKARTVKIRSGQGRTRTLQAGKEAGSLDRVRAGDTVAVEYLETVRLWPAGLEEGKGEQAAITGLIEPGEKSAGPCLAEAATSAQVAAMDRVRGAVTLRMPDRSVLVVRAGKPADIKRLGIGDTVILTLAKIEAVSIMPAR